MEPPLPAGLAAALNSRQSVLELKVPGPSSRAALQVYVDGATPPLPDEEDIDTIIAGLAIALPRRRDTAATDGAKLEIYATALSDVPLADLAAAADTMVKTAKFFPTVAEIREAARKASGPRVARIARARILIMRHDRDWVPPSNEADPSQVARIAGKALAAHPTNR